MEIKRIFIQANENDWKTFKETKLQKGSWYSGFDKARDVYFLISKIDGINDFEFEVFFNFQDYYPNKIGIFGLNSRPACEKGRSNSDEYEKDTPSNIELVNKILKKCFDEVIIDYCKQHNLKAEMIYY